MDSRSSTAPEPHFLPALLGDGRPLFTLTGLALILSGGFALFLSATGAFLPHDVAFLGMEPKQFCALHQCRLVHFMFHDRVAFGGVLLSIGTLYLWLAQFPLRLGQEWAWWVFALSGGTGFASFLCYLGYGYLDTWHGLATLALLPCFLLGLWKTRALLPAPRLGLASLFRPDSTQPWRTRTGLGRLCLMAVACGNICAGAAIMYVGMTTVFVPEDLKFLGLRAADLNALNPRLIPLIAHDRAGFGGGLVSCGCIVLLIIWKAPITPALWQALLIAGSAGFACAIGVHFPIGYTDFIHLAPAYVGAIFFVMGLALTHSRTHGQQESAARFPHVGP